MKIWAKQKGFTIVELLIVIVVIGILAAITIVAYNGIQSRAYNTAVIAAARQTLGLANQYVAANGAYPSTAAELCATQNNACLSNLGAVVTADNTSFMNALKTLGTPVSAPPSGSAGGYYGILYYYFATGTYNGSGIPAAYIFYVLKGVNTQCGLPNVADDARISYATSVSSTTGNSWTTSTLGGITGCYIYINKP